MFEHVERERLGERAVRERQPAQVADQQIDALPRVRGKERTDVDADGRRSPVAIPEKRATAAAPKIDDEVVRFRGEERAQHVVPDPRTEAAAATPSRAARRRGASRRGILSVPHTPRAAGDRDSQARRCGTAVRSHDTRASRASRQARRDSPDSERATAALSEIISPAAIVSVNSASSRSARRCHE